MIKFGSLIIALVALINKNNKK
ncbi:putative holin-like toxin [Enterococcus casseliflavus]